MLIVLQYASCKYFIGDNSNNCMLKIKIREEKLFSFCIFYVYNIFNKFMNNMMSEILMTVKMLSSGL